MKKNPNDKKGDANNDFDAEGEFVDPWDKDNSWRQNDEKDGGNDNKNSSSIESFPDNIDSVIDISEQEKIEKQKELLKNILTEYKCSIIGVSNGIVGVVTGSFLGALQGFMYNRQHYGKSGFGSVIFSASASSAGSFGLWLGSYSYVKCQLVVTRRKNDMLNTFSAAFFAGAITSLSSSGRNPSRVILNGLVSGVLMSVFDTGNL